MILRVWRAKIRNDLVDEAEAFMRERLFPVFKDHGCVGAEIAVGGNKDSPDMLIVSLWESTDSLEALTKGKGVILPESSKFILGNPSIEHFDVVGTL